MRTATTTAAAAAKAADDQNRLENHPLDCAMRQPLAYVYLKEEPGWRAAAKLWVQQGCHLSTGLTMAAQFLFHRDPKRIVGILRVTILNRLNGAREWAELPLGRQTPHHDWLSG